MRVTPNKLHYSVNGMIEVCEYYTTANRKQKFKRKLAEEIDLNPG